MWVQQHGKKFRFFERFPLPNGTYRTLSVTMEKNNAQTRKLAQQVLAEKAGSVQVKEFTLQEVATAFLEDYRRINKPQSYKDQCHAFNVLVGLLGASQRMSGITAGYIRSVLLAQGKSDTWVNGRIRKARQLFKWAFLNDYIPTNTTGEKLQLVKNRPEESDGDVSEKFLDRDELAAVLDACGSEKWKLIIEFLAMSGLRFGELAALNKSDVTADYIRVNKTYSRRMRTESLPKTARSRRDVYIQPELADCIARIKAYNAARYMRYPELRKCSLWFPTTPSRNSADLHLSNQVFNKHLSALTENVTGRHLTAHALRHTHASLLFEQGFTVEQVGRRLGHERDSKVTQMIYIHVTKGLKAKDAEAFKAIRIL